MFNGNTTDPVVHALTHGLLGLEFAYILMLGAILEGLIRARGSWEKLLLSPLFALPVLIVAEILIEVINGMARTVGIGGDLKQFLIGALVLMLGGHFSGRMLAQYSGTSSNPQHRRGATVMSAQGSPGGLFSPGSRGPLPEECITIAGLPIPFEDETKHFKLIGTTGTGKSTAIREMLRGALARGDRAIIADPDGGYLNRFYDPSRADVILNPFDEDARKWDLFGEINNDYDVNQLVRSLIPDGTDSDHIWCEFARTFLIALIKQAIRAGNRNDSEIFRLVNYAELDELKVMLAGTPAGQFLNEGNEKVFGSLRSVAIAAVQALEYTTQQEAEPFSIRRWVREGAARHAGGPGGVLFIPYSAGQIAALRSIISAWLRLAIFQAMDRGEADQRLWFFIDEVDALGEIDGLQDALARLRKYGGRCAIGLQSITQMSGTYGKSKAGTIVENCSNTAIFRCSASEQGGTSEFASKLIGQREVIHTTKSRTGRFLRGLSPTTTSEHLKIEPAVLASEIERLPDLTAFLKLASIPDWQSIKLTPRNDPFVARPARPSAQQKPTAPAMASSTPDLATPPPSINHPRKSREARKAAPRRPGRPKPASKRDPIPPGNVASASLASPQNAVPNPGDGSLHDRASGADSKN
jgi:type IV secretory pathway TraG/TraD family ATPase VirD4